MKFTFVIILLLGFLFCFSQNKSETDSSNFWPGNDFSKKSDSGSEKKFPIHVNAIVPVDNYFRNGQFLFEKWVRGMVVTADNKLVQNQSWFYNYNKFSKSLFATKDFNNIIEIDKREFKSFTLTDDTAQYFFEHVFLLDNHRFFQALVKSDGYSLYKYTASNLRKDENLKGRGEFIDSYFYYIIFPGNKNYTTIRLTRKSIIRNFIAEQKKTNSYFNDHKNDNVDEFFLIGFVNYLNK